MTCAVMPPATACRYARAMNLSSVPSVGALVRQWRQRRRLSQLDLALDAEVSTRHLSYVETGRAMPSREMLLRLADRLDVPLRERNALLLAGGYAPMYRERALADPSMAAARLAVDLILAGHLPHPALVVDRWWNIVAHNAAVAPLLDGIAPALLAPPPNALRLSLHPQGLAPRIVNLGAWRGHLLARLHKQIEVSADPHDAGSAPAGPDLGGVAVPLQLRLHGRTLNLLSTTTIFGTPVDVTLSELALETFFPADEATAAALRELTPSRAAPPAAA
jgi:transcriptional regulator with XRE-family HTH domain